MGCTGRTFLKHCPYNRPAVWRALPCQREGDWMFYTDPAKIHRQMYWCWNKCLTELSQVCYNFFNIGGRLSFSTVSVEKGVASCGCSEYKKLTTDIAACCPGRDALAQPSGGRDAQLKRFEADRAGTLADFSVSYLLGRPFCFSAILDGRKEMARRNNIVGFRANDSELGKLETISQQTGMSVSEVLRSLVRTAEIETAVIVRSTSYSRVEARQ